MGILVRAVAVAAALTSTSLRERWREPGDEAAAGVLLWAALAGGQFIIILKLCLNQLMLKWRFKRARIIFHRLVSSVWMSREFYFLTTFTNKVKSDVNLHRVVLLPKVFLTDRGRLRRRTQQRTSSVNHRRSRLQRKLQQCVHSFNIQGSLDPGFISSTAAAE